MYYNEYINTLKGRLRSYTDFQVYLDNLKARIELIQERMALEPVPKTTQYREMPGGGGFDHPSAQELYAERLEDDEAMLRQLTQRYKDTQAKLVEIDRCMECIPGLEAEMVKRHCINHQPWKVIADDYDMDESYCRRLCRNGLRKMAGMIWGPEVAPVQLTLMFWQS